MGKELKAIAAMNVSRKEIYRPKTRPGFVAWTTAFSYQDGSIGLVFKETIEMKNEWYRAPKLEMGEAICSPVSYASVECGSEDKASFRVYLRSFDNGKTFTETGRCPIDEGSFCNAGFPDGRIIGIDVSRMNEEGSGWCNYIEIRESLDGGNSWRTVNRLLEGCSPYMWRVRQLKDGTIVIGASLYGTPWGPGKERNTRNTMLPGETYLNKIQTFFMCSKDGGRSFDGPNYILPGTGAHEFDFVELQDGSLLFIQGDVQGTPVSRQIVQRKDGRYINGSLYGISRGAPPDPAANPQGGFVPETLVMLPDGTIVGARRNKPYTCSNDLGKNWYEIENLPVSLYQPFMMLMPDGSIANFGHFGGDSAFGQVDMFIGADFFTFESHLPKPGKLTIKREMHQSGTHYLNRFTAQLTSGDIPVEGEALTFRFNPVWNTDGSLTTLTQDQAPLVKKAVTDKNGIAGVSVNEFDGIGDIHFYYNVDVIYRPDEDSDYMACDGPMMCVAALTPHRFNRYPYDSYFAEGALFLSPSLLNDYPDAIDLLRTLCGNENYLEREKLPEGLIERLRGSGVLISDGNRLRWIKSVHAPQPLNEVLMMAGGDWYV